MFTLPHYQNKQRQAVCKATLRDVKMRPLPRKQSQVTECKALFLKSQVPDKLEMYQLFIQGLKRALSSAEPDSPLYEVTFLMKSWGVMAAELEDSQPTPWRTEPLSEPLSHQLELTPTCLLPPSAPRTHWQPWLYRPLGASSGKGAQPRAMI